MIDEETHDDNALLNSSERNIFDGGYQRQLCRTSFKKRNINVGIWNICTLRVRETNTALKRTGQNQHEHNWTV